MINYISTSATIDSNDFIVGGRKREKIATDLENKFDIYYYELDDIYYLECAEDADQDFRRLLSTLCDSDNDSQWMWSHPTVYTAASASTIHAESYDYYFKTQEKVIAAINYLKDVADITFSLEVEMLISSSIKKIKEEK